MIPISKPYLGEAETEAATKVILSGWVTQGPKVKEFEEVFAGYVGSEFACAVSSCTAALHLSLLAVGVQPGDVVITVSHSFIATANSVRYCYAEPVFVDIGPKTYNISPEKLENFIETQCEEINGRLYYKNISNIATGESPLKYLLNGNQKIGRVAAVLPVHQMGIPCDIKNILKIAKKYNLPVVEDAACAIGIEITPNGKNPEKIGKPHGDIACFSFHPRKILTTGDGGMITTNNPEFDKKVRLLRQHSMSISDTARHNTKEVITEKYLSTGFNYRMTDIQAAIGIEQLKRLPGILEERKNLDNLYRIGLKDLDWLELPYEPEYAKSNQQSYPVRVLENAPISRNKLMQYLLDNEISTKPGIMNAHREVPYRNFDWELPESERARKEVILLPLYNLLKNEEVQKIVNLIKELK